MEAAVTAADPTRATPVIATEGRVATNHVGGSLYNNSVKKDCYASTSDDSVYKDAEALAPAYAARVVAIAYALLHDGVGGFTDAQAWESTDWAIADVHHAGPKGLESVASVFLIDVVLPSLLRTPC